MSVSIFRFVGCAFLLFVCFLNNMKSDCLYVEVNGSTPYEVGYNIGNKMKDLIIEYFELMTEDMKEEELKKWKIIANGILPTIKKYSLVAYEELRGMGDVEGLSLEMISMMNCEFEFKIANFYGTESKTSRKCTGFVSTSGGNIITGQTIDENPTPNMGYIVLRRNDDSIVVTHPGLLMYMGMNNKGVVAENQYIDNGEYSVDDQDFVPGGAIMREILEKNSLSEIEEYLREVPHGIPGNYMIVKSKEGYFDIELSPTNFSSLFQPISKKDKFSYFCHTNTIIFNQAMMDGDLKKDPSSVPRLELCKNMTRGFNIDGDEMMTVNDAKKMFNTPPILRSGEWHNVYSCNTLIFEPDTSTIHVKWYEDKIYDIYKL